MGPQFVLRNAQLGINFAVDFNRAPQGIEPNAANRVADYNHLERVQRLATWHVKGLGGKDLAAQLLFRPL